jgi:hypothetical protein
MASFLGPAHGVIVFTEAAGNSATLSPCASISPLRGEFTVVSASGTVEFDHDIYIFAAQVMGDVANLTRIVLDNAAQAGGQYLLDIREGMPAETSTAQATGFHNLMNRQIHLKGGQILRCQWTEDASTNVEPSVVLFYSLAPFPTQKHPVQHNTEKGGALDVTLAITSTTAVTWTRSTNVMGPNNGDTTAFDEEKNYIICGHRTTGSATQKAVIIELAGLKASPGIAGATDNNVSDIPIFDPLEYVPISCTGKELNRATIAQVDVAGSETATEVFSIRRQ